LSKTLKLFYSHGEMIPIATINSTDLQVPIQVIIISTDHGRYEGASWNFQYYLTQIKGVLGWKISQKTYQEIKHANALIKQLNKIRKSQCCVMDKKYDSEKIHSLIGEKIKADSIIHVRRR
jgi:hypothetical protein